MERLTELMMMRGRCVLKDWGPMRLGKPTQKGTFMKFMVVYIP
jgi:hypothetical protein